MARTKRDCSHVAYCQLAETSIVLLPSARASLHRCHFVFPRPAVAGADPRGFHRVPRSHAGGHLPCAAGLRQGTADLRYLRTRYRFTLNGDESALGEAPLEERENTFVSFSNSKYTGGAISNGEFKAQGGVSAFLDDFDFDAHCVIQGYQLTYLAPQQEPVTVVNAGPRFNAESRSLVNRAQPGDIYHFDNVKARCPGDVAERLINSMAFKIQ